MTLHRRAWPVGDLLRSYKIVIDGKVVGTIRRRQTKSVEVLPGHHAMHLEIDWCRSRELDLDLAPGEELRLDCKGPWPGLAAFTQSQSYITIDPAKGAT